MFLGIGGGPEGVLAASALDAFGCKFQGRFLFEKDEEKKRAKQMGIKDFNKKYEISEIVRGDSIFCATGITSGDLVSGVRKENGKYITETLKEGFDSPRDRQMQYFVYLIISNKNQNMISYVGYTNNLKKRLKEHNSSKGAKFTRGGFWELAYSKSYISKSVAMKEEYKLKKNYKLRNKIKNIFLNNENFNHTSI